MSVALVILALALGLYTLGVAEHWSSFGRLRIGAPISSALALMAKEEMLPRKGDRLLYEAGPALLLVAAALSSAVIPLSPDLVIADLATGALFFNAALAYVLVALIMAGWGPNGGYAMIGGWRFLGQLLGYSMLIVMPITAVAMRAESLSTVAIVQSQVQLWNIAYQPLGFVLFAIAAQALAFLPPFDLPISRTELAGGVEAEYTGPRLLVFRLARLTIVLSLAGAGATFYLGGWTGPLLPDWAWAGLKTLLLAVGMLAIGPYLPRIREAQFLAFCWKLGIPLALLNIFVVGVLVLVVPI